MEVIAVQFVPQTMLKSWLSLAIPGVVVKAFEGAQIFLSIKCLGAFFSSKVNGAQVKRMPGSPRVLT